MSYNNNSFETIIQNATEVVMREFIQYRDKFSRIRYLTDLEIRKFIIFKLQTLAGTFYKLSQYTLDCYGIGSLYALDRNISFLRNKEDHDIYDAVYTWTEDTETVITTRTYRLGFVEKNVFDNILKENK